ncbi:hypothetical protein PX699_22860 [Sphingobium sp. H39-3-25]|nr:hypothetical protein [Sphingobium arseniciresistens]
MSLPVDLLGTSSVTVDGAFVRVTRSGMWTESQARDHYRELDTLLKRIRLSSGGANVLLDLTQAMVQTSAVAKVIAEATANIYKPVDRVSVLCSSALVGLQIKRQARIDNLATFSDEAAALEWLFARPPTT